MTIRFQVWLRNWLEDRIRRQLKSRYPEGCKVAVDHPRFHGIGVVQWQPCAPHVVPVLLQNGNVWWYEAWTVKRIIAIGGAACR